MKKFFPLSLVILIASCGDSNGRKAVDINNEGMKFLAQRNYDSAISYFNRAASFENLAANDRAKFLRNSAVAYSEQRKYDSAIAYYTKAMNVSTLGSYYQLVNNADLLLLKDSIPMAITLLQKAVEKAPTEMDANNLLGLIYLGEYGEDYYNPGKALQYNLKAYELNNERSTQYVVAKNYYHLKDYKNARKEFESLYEQYPNADYLLSLIIVCEDSGDKESADKYKAILKEKFPNAIN